MLDKPRPHYIERTRKIAEYTINNPIKEMSEGTVYKCLNILNLHGDLVYKNDRMTYLITSSFLNNLVNSLELRIKQINN